MSIEYIKGFKIFEGDTLIIESEKIRECMEFFLNTTYLDKVWISRFHGYMINDISFLKDYNFIKKIVLDGPFEISGLYCLKDLEFLSYVNYGKDHLLDLSQFENLKTCYLDFKSKIKNLNSLTSVKNVRLFNYSVKEKNLTGLNGLTNLQSLYISISNLESLLGIEAFKELKSIELHYFRSLSCIQQVTSLNETLTFLTFGNAKKIVDFESVTALKKLKTLGFNYCGTISSVKFINDMPSLEDFRFMGTDVIDGDLSPLKRLKYAAFVNKKHYSLTYEELAKLHAHTIGM